MIGNDIFQCGGYLTVNEFIAEYGDRYDMSDFHLDKEFEEARNYATTITEKTNGLKVIVTYTQPVSGTGAFGDAVVMAVTPESEELYTCTWFPNGLSYRFDNTESLDSITNAFESNGLTASDTSYGKPLGDNLKTPASINEIVGQYVFLDSEGEFKFAIGAVELVSDNLYGVKSVISYIGGAYDGAELGFTNYWYNTCNSEQGVEFQSKSVK